jgi:hypothetical protein
VDFYCTCISSKAFSYLQVPLGNSDHETLEFNFRFGIKQKKHYQNKLCWFKGNYEKINAQLNKIDWNLKLAQGDINNL